MQNTNTPQIPAKSAKVIDLSSQFSSYSFPVGTKVSHPTFGLGTVAQVIGFERVVNFYNWVSVEPTLADHALAAMDGGEVESVEELSAKDYQVTVAKIKKVADKPRQQLILNCPYVGALFQ